jgi:hypothetical protein
MAVRKKPSEIYLAWVSIVFPEAGYESPTSECGRTAFRELWEVHGAGGKYLNLDPEDASLLCSLGWKLAMEQAKYEESLEWTRLMPFHPGFSELDDVNQLQPDQDAFYSYAYLKDIKQLCRITRVLSENPDYLAWRYSSSILFLDEIFPPDHPVDSLILDVAKGVLRAKKRYSRLVRKLEKTGITYREMREVGVKTLNQPSERKAQISSPSRL